MSDKFVTLTPELAAYISAHRSPDPDSVLDELRTETEKLGSISGMQISAEQGTFLSLLVAATGATSAIEVGTFTGYSSISIARGLPAGGKLLCFDISEEWTNIARRYWKLAGVDEKIELKLGAAVETLAAMDPALQFDFAFIDADKPGYDAYYEAILPRMRANGLLIFDNMLRGGTVVGGDPNDEGIKVITDLNAKLAGDSRVQSVLLPIADGLNICRKL